MWRVLGVWVWRIERQRATYEPRNILFAEHQRGQPLIRRGEVTLSGPIESVALPLAMWAFLINVLPRDHWDCLVVGEVNERRGGWQRVAYAGVNPATLRIAEVGRPLGRRVVAQGFQRSICRLVGGVRPASAGWRLVEQARVHC